ncbi:MULTISPECIES: hypothetical protein [unclassified Empedobacter]|uniref:hypothetical protein n=2 Tax=Empedobacter TaxID=59734 RepID=UPI000ECC1E2E|nr:MULTISPECIES: hypothetical protein [unclassified Empedobacter]HCC94927.1 hypothetical protein [Flavobacteriaceae bacterium]
MNYKILSFLMIISINTFGQDRINYIEIENTSSHLWSNTTIYIESPNANFQSSKNNKKDKVLVEIKMNLKEDHDYKKVMYINLNDFEEISTKLLNLNPKDLFPHIQCLDGNHTILSFSNDSNSVKYNISCTNKETKFHQVLEFILDKINLKEKDFYR